MQSSVRFGLTLMCLSGLVGTKSFALVSSPVSIREGQWGLELNSTIERGKIEPNENIDSFQKARINILQVAALHGMPSSSWGVDHTLKVEAKYITSSEEQVDGTTFYESDQGATAGVTHSFNFVHASTHTIGMYIGITPFVTVNRDKFSLPRLDLVSVGLTSGLEVSKDVFVENSLHIGSGIPTKQNAYTAFTQTIGYRLSQALVAKGGVYAEMDLTERYDESYDSYFSSPGRRDRIRSAKIGVLGKIAYNFSAAQYVALTYIQKLGGYDAPATNAAVLTYGVAL